MVDEVWSYAPTNGLSLWSEVQTNGAPWQAGLFAGYYKNFGARAALSPDPAQVFARGYNIADIYRLSPRLLYNIGKMRFALESELTGTGYGTPDAYGKVQSARHVTNLRLLFAAYYFF